MFVFTFTSCFYTFRHAIPIAFKKNHALEKKKGLFIAKTVHIGSLVLQGVDNVHGSNSFR